MAERSGNPSQTPSTRYAGPLALPDVNASDQPGAYQLPGYLVLLIGLAMLIMWLSLAALLVGMIVSGTGLNLMDIIPLHMEGAMRSALIFQYAVIFLNLLLLFIFGNVICILWLASAHDIAVISTIWLVRLSLVMMFVQIFASNAMPAAIGGVIAALPGVVTQVPFMLVSAAFLVFADRTLVHRRAQS